MSNCPWLWYVVAFNAQFELKEHISIDHDAALEAVYGFTSIPWGRWMIQLLELLYHALGPFITIRKTSEIVLAFLYILNIVSSNIRTLYFISFQTLLYSARSSHSCNLLNLQYIKLISASIVWTHIIKGAYLFLLTKSNMLNVSVGNYQHV